MATGGGSEDGALVFSTGDEKMVLFWSTASKDCAAILKGHSAVSCDAVSTDGTYINMVRMTERSVWKRQGNI